MKMKFHRQSRYKAALLSHPGCINVYQFSRQLKLQHFNCPMRVQQSSTAPMLRAPTRAVEVAPTDVTTGQNSMLAICEFQQIITAIVDEPVMGPVWCWGGR